MIPKNKMQAAIRSNPDKSASFVYMEIIRQHMEFEQKIKNYIKQNNMVTRGDKVLAGISGGADSTCLLYVLSHLKEQMGFELCVVHVNHGIRQEAQEDAVYVEKICKQLMIPFFLRTEDVPLIACREGLTEEEAGRSVRYAVFEELADKVCATKIAVAHNRNDLAETMLLNLFRGTGVHGAGAIRPVRGRIIRPLLDTERTEIEEYLRKKGISYQTDKTNLEDDHTRNRIRHHILPYAQQEINNRAVQHLARAAQEISEAVFRMDGATAQVSYDGGSTWDTSPTVELPDFYSYEEFAGWIETESDNLQALVAAGELTQEEAAAAIAQYQSALSGIEDGVQVGKRSSYEEDQIFFSMPNNPQSEVFQTVLYDGNSYRNFGPYNTKAELYAALEQYTNEQTKSGNMTEVEANSILDKYR